MRYSRINESAGADIDAGIRLLSDDERAAVATTTLPLDPSHVGVRPGMADWDAVRSVVDLHGIRIASTNYNILLFKGLAWRREIRTSGSSEK